MANLSKAEKSVLFTNGASGVDRINWPKYNWWSEALHGVARDGVGTSFPQIGLVAASMNRTLWHEIGDVTSTEGRGKNNDLKGGMYQGLTFWAPNVNIFRDPVRTILQPAAYVYRLPPCPYVLTIRCVGSAGAAARKRRARIPL